MSWALVLTWVSPFVHDKKGVCFGWDKNRFSHYDIRAEGALPPSITMIARMVGYVFWTELVQDSEREREREREMGGGGVNRVARNPPLIS